MSVIKTHVILVIWGAVEIVLFGGIIFGWASLVYIYKQEGLFQDYCRRNNNNTFHSTNITSILLKVNQSFSIEQDGIYNNVTDHVSQIDFGNGCQTQDKLFNLIYVLAAVINGVASFPNGVIWDKYGTRIMRVIGAVTFVPGLLLAAFVTKETALLLFPSMILIAYGGYVVLLTNFQLGNLLPKRKSMIISLYCGAYDSSAFMLVLIKWGYAAGIATKFSFIIMLTVYSAYIISTFWYMPKMRVPFPLPTNFRINLFSCLKKTRSENANKDDLSVIDGTIAQMIEKQSDTRQDDEKTVAQFPCKEPKRKMNYKTEIQNESFVKEAVSMLFIWDVIWLTLMRLQSWSFVGRLNPALERLSGGDQEVVSHYTSIYACLQFFGIFLAPLSGCLMDRKKHRDVDPALKKIEMIEVCIASFVIDNTFGLLLAITMTIPVLQVQYLSFVFHVVHRALLYGPNTAFIAQGFSSLNFGKLFGLVMTVSAAISLIQFPLFILVQGPLKGDPLFFNLLILFLMIIAYGHPLYLKMWCRKQRKFYEEHKDTNKDVAM